MPKTVITTEIEQFIRDNRFELTRNDMAKLCGVSSSAIGYYMKAQNLTIPKALSHKLRANKIKGKSTYTQLEDDFLKANYLKMPVKTMAEKLNRSKFGVNYRLGRLGLVIPKELIEERKKASQFSKGSIPPNKGKKLHEFMTPERIERFKSTQFKKGHEVWNKKPIGSERLSKDGYIYIKTKEPNIYELKHRVIYENHFGPIPNSAKTNVQFKDGDKTNLAIENLYLISQEEQALHNSKGGNKLPYEAKKVLTTLSKINKKLKTIKS